MTTSKSHHHAAAIFDMDGTLMNNMKYHAEAWVALFRDQGLDITLDNYWGHDPGGKAQEVVRMFLGNDLADSEVMALVAQKEFLYRYTLANKIKPMRGVRRLLKDAKKAGIPIALATAAGPRNIQFAMEALQLREYFDILVGAADVERGKPHPDLFLLAAEKLGFAPADCLVFEDSYPGLEAAHRAGMQSIAITTMHSAKELKKMPGVIAVIDHYAGLSLSKLLNGKMP